MSTESTTMCPNCGVSLPTAGLAAGVTVQCARCGRQFSLGAAPLAPPPTTSGKATASLVLGIIPGFCFTGVPAILMGILALVDIRRAAGRLKGSGMAVTGIALGTVCGVVCTPLLGGLIWLVTNVVKESKFSDKPEEIAPIAAKFGTFQVPEGINTIAGMDTGFVGMRMVIYGDRQNNPSTMIMMMQFPPFMAGTQKDMERQMQQQWKSGQKMGINTETTNQLTYTIRSQPTQVAENIGKEPNTGKRVRQYIALLPGDGGPLMVMIITSDPPEDDGEKPETEETVVRLTEEQVKEFLESIQ